MWVVGIEPINCCTIAPAVHAVLKIEHAHTLFQNLIFVWCEFILKVCGLFWSYLLFFFLLSPLFKLFLIVFQSH